jgi:hypothetical protein
MFFLNFPKEIKIKKIIIHPIKIEILSWQYLFAKNKLNHIPNIESYEAIGGILLQTPLDQKCTFVKGYNIFIFRMGVTILQRVPPTLCLLRIEFLNAMSILITKGFIFMEGLFSWKACGPYVIWEKGDTDWKEDKKRIVDHFLLFEIGYGLESCLGEEMCM